LKNLMDKLKKDVVNTNGIATYVATQGNRSADGKQVFHRRHISWGFNKLDAIDYGFGIADTEDQRLNQLEDGDDNLEAAEAQGITQTGRKLAFSFFKLRDGHASAFNVYQAPTLRLFNTQPEYQRATTAMEVGGLPALYGGRS